MDALVLCFCLALGLIHTTEEKVLRRGRVPPHIVFVMVDDQGYNDIGYHGSEIHMSVLDQLAGEGVKPENYYVQPICSPLRSQLMTGRYQIHTGLQHSIIRAWQPLCILTLPARLRQAGYSTHMVGKWHLGFCRPECLPTSRGFQRFLGSLTGSGDHFSFQSCDGTEACGFDLHDGERPAWELSGNYSTRLYTERVKEILKGHDQRTPLFLYVALQAVHTPLQAPGHLLRHYQTLGNRPRRHYAAMVSGVDESATLSRIYSSDNGGQPLSGGCNWPLHGGKGSYWEGGVRAVGFVHSPLLKRKGVVSQVLIHVSDWYPTLLSLAGYRESDSSHLDGQDVWGAISSGLPCPRTEILFNIDPVSRKHGEVDLRLLNLNGFGIWDTRVRAAIRAGDWKLLTGNVGPQQWQGMEKRRDQRGKSFWLFNNTADPYERADLAESRPEVVKVLLTQLAEYSRTAVPPRNPPDDPMDDQQLHGGVWTPWLGQEEAGNEEDDEEPDNTNRKARSKSTCRVCKLRALFKKVGTRMQRDALFL
uniref:Si:dkey-174i8.1 n=1 Tax=Sinocyclocheilus anshuiensis TaxID=1608454 RepID=A0A671RH96_9TELE